jgi:AraC-like DNA-binding protein
VKSTLEYPAEVMARADIPTGVAQKPAVCGRGCLSDYFDSIETNLVSPLAVRAVRLLRQEPTAFLSVGEWAERLQVSREHLTRSISPVINPHALIRATRLSLAMGRLAEQKRLRASLALSVMGYSSRAHAFTVFKSSTGLTPSEWWRRHRAANDDGRTACVVERCPLLGALLDRAHEHTDDRESAASMAGASPAHLAAMPALVPGATAGSSLRN